MANDSRLTGTQQAQLVESRHLWYAVLVVVSLACAIGLLFAGPTLVFGLLSIIFLAVMLLHNPYLGVLAYIVFEYARLSAMFPGLQNLQFGKLIVLTTLIIFLIRRATSHDIKIVPDKMYALLLVWLGIALVSMAFAMNMQMAFDATVDLAKWFVICFLIINLVDTLPKLQVFMWLFLLLNLKLAQFQIRSFVAGLSAASNQDYFIREGIGSGSGGYFANGNDFGMAMVIVVPLAFYLFLSVKSRILKVIAGAMTATFVIALLRSSSRGAALGLAAATALYWARSRNKLVNLALVIAFLAGFWAFASDPWKQRFLNAQNYEEDSTASSRITLWKGGISMFTDHPLTGVGINNFSSNWVSKYRPSGVRGATVVHNIFLQAASELGFGGLVVVVAVLILIFRRNQETRRICREANLSDPWLPNISLALDCSLIGFIVHGFFLTVLYYPHLYIIAALTLALHAIAKKQALSSLPVSSLPSL
jgi:putative inorganic carbon (hco3(-)) transporter